MPTTKDLDLEEQKLFLKKQTIALGELYRICAGTVRELKNLGNLVNAIFRSFYHTIQMIISQYRNHIRSLDDQIGNISVKLIWTTYQE